VHDLYDIISHPLISRIVKSVTNKDEDIFQYNSILLYGIDSNLIYLYIYHILQSNFGVTCFKRNYLNTIVNHCELQYIESSYFIEIDLDTHLNKDKSAYVDFIKTLVSSRNVAFSKHIIILKNFDKLSNIQQNKLRHVIEYSQNNALFIIYCKQFNNVITEIQSRLFTIRVPSLKNTQQINLINHIILKHDLYEQPNDVAYKIFLNMETNNPILCIDIMNIYLTTLTYIIKVQNSKDSNCNSNEPIPNVLKDELLVLFEYYKKNRKFCIIPERIRETIYKINHYNFKISTVVHTIIHILLPMKYMNNTKIHNLINTLAEFEYTSTQITPSKIFHCYEKYLINIFCIIKEVPL